MVLWTPILCCIAGFERVIHCLYGFARAPKRRAQQNAFHDLALEMRMCEHQVMVFSIPA
jgi:hypothetical protein